MRLILFRSSCPHRARHPLAALTLLLATVLLAGTPALSAPSDRPLTLAAATARALAQHPALRASALEVEAAAARAQQAAARPNPELDVTLENALGTGALSGVKSLESTVQLSQAIDLAGTRQHRHAAASGEHAVAATDRDLARIDVLAEVASRFIETAADAQRLEVARDARLHAARTVDAARQRVDAARASPLELNKARTALALAEIDEEHAEHELLVCRHALAAALGDAAPHFTSVQADLFTLPSLPEFAALAARLETSPRLGRFATETRWREAQVDLARSLRRSPARVSAGLRRVENTDDFGLVMGFSIPLPVRDRNAGSIRDAELRRDQVAAEAETARLDLRATLFAVYQELQHARTAFARLRASIIPDAEQSRDFVERGYREGRFTLTELFDAQRTPLQLRRDLIDHAATVHLHVVTLERLLGGPLSTP